MTKTHQLLLVFVDPAGAGGNPLGVVLEGGAMSDEERQAIAAELGYSETVFVEDSERGRLRIHTPTVELPLAGHPLVGAAWLLAHDGAAVDTLRPPAGDVPTWSDDDGLTWIRGRPEWGPPYDMQMLDSVAAVDALQVPGGDALLAAWAWEDETAGRLRARVFPNRIGIIEDEATGAAALQFGALLGRELLIRQGAGSELHVRPFGDGTVAVGGRVVLVR